MWSVLLRRPLLDVIAAGTATGAFRRRQRRRVCLGGTRRTPIGVRDLTAVGPVGEQHRTGEDAGAAAFAGLAELIRVRTAHAGRRRRRSSRSRPHWATRSGLVEHILDELGRGGSRFPGYRLPPRGRADRSG